VLVFLGVGVREGVEVRSLWPLIRGERTSLREHVFSGRYPNELARALGQGRGSAAQAAAFDGAAGVGTASTRLVEALTVTAEEWSLISSPQGRPSELYDLRDDPYQERNRIAERPEVARELHRALLRFLEESGAAPARMAPFRGDPVASGETPEPPALAEDTPLFVAADDRGLPIAFRQAEGARALGGGRPPRQTTFGALRREQPRTLLHTPTQYYWLSDLA
jgi:hypothetical protein